MNSINSNDVPGVVTVLSQKYAINLLWNKVSQGEKPIKEAKEAAKVLQTSLVCIDFNLCGYQYGLADSKIGHKRGMSVLATQVDTSIGSVCGVWEIDDVWLVLAVNRDGLIIQDKGVRDRNDALLEFNDLIHSDEWDRVFCPPEWAISNSQFVHISEIIKKRKTKKIKSVGTLNGMTFFWGASFIVFLFISLYVYDELSGEKEQQELPLSMMVSEGGGQKEAKVYMPWSEQYLPFRLLAGCKRLIAENVLNASSMPGWIWDGHVICDGNNVRFTIIREGGFTFWLDSVEQFITPQPKLSIVTEDKAYLSWNIQNVNKYPKEALSLERFNSIKEIKKMLTQEFSMAHQNINFGQDVAMTLGGDNIIKCDFSFSVSSDPGIYFSALLKVYGIVVNKIEYTEDSGQWSVWGEFWGV